MTRLRPLALLALPMLLWSATALADGELKRQKLLVLDLKTTGVSEDTASLVAEMMVVSLSEFEALEVFAGADVKRMMELEADKFASGCEDEGSCIADIAGALGARYVIYGRLGKLGSRFVCTLNLFDADEGKAINRQNIKGKDLDQLSDRMDKSLNKLVAPLVGDEKIATSVEKNKPPEPELPNVPPPARDDEGARALKLGLMVGGGSLAVLSWGTAAIYAAAFDGIDPFAFLNYLPVLGPVIYATVGPEAIGGEPICYTCAAFQAVGLATAIAGAFIGGGDPGASPDAKRVEIPSAPLVANANAPPREQMAF